MVVSGTVFRAGEGAVEDDLPNQVLWLLGAQAKWVVAVVACALYIASCAAFGDGNPILWLSPDQLGLL